MNGLTGRNIDSREPPRPITAPSKLVNQNGNAVISIAEVKIPTRRGIVLS
jgi:hypothetical protein